MPKRPHQLIPLRLRPWRRIPVIRTMKRPGTAPGTIVVDPESPAPRITVIAYGPDDACRHELERPAQIRDHLGRWPVTWVNVDGLGDEAVLAEIAEIFGVHRLALEDVVHVHQRAKVEPFDEHLFVVARMVHHDRRVATEQMSLFLGRDWVLTFQERPGDSFDLVRQRIETAGSGVRKGGAGYLAYALVDALVDAFFPVLEQYSEHLESLEDLVLAAPVPRTVNEIHGVKRDLLAMRRAIWPHREAIGALMRDETPLIDRDTRLHLRDVQDHVIQVIDLVETYRELASGLMDLYLSSVGNRMNEIMKVLTIFAALFIPLSFLVGLWGMNFQSMPELRWRWGYPAALAFMAAVAGVLLLFFRRKGWIGDGAPAPPDEDDPAGD